MASGNGNGWRTWGAIMAALTLALGIAVAVGGSALDGKASKDSVQAIGKQVDATDLTVTELEHSTIDRHEDMMCALAKIVANQRVIAHELGINLGE